MGNKENRVNDFKDLLQKKKNDPSIDLHEYSKKEMERLINGRHKKKEKCSALQKEVVTMGKERMSSLSKSLLPPSWRKAFEEEIFKDWLPTAENINALPEPVRNYIAALETNADPPSMVRENIIMRDTIKALEKEFLKDPSSCKVNNEISKLRHEFLGDPLTYEVEGIDPEVLEKIPIEDFVKNASKDPPTFSEIVDDPELHEMETGIHYEIKICWEGGAPESVCKSLEKIYINHMKLFLCVPEKFAGAALLVAMDWEGGQIHSPRHKDKEDLIPSEMVLVSTGCCFEESKHIKIEKSDRIHVFNKSRRLFVARDFSLQRKSDIIVYRSRTP